MDEKTLLNRLHFLSHSLFIVNPDGKEFLRLMKYLHVLTPTFPQKPDLLEAFGGGLGWASYREGQLTLIRSIDAMAQNYLDKLAAENTTTKEVNK